MCDCFLCKNKGNDEIILAYLKGVQETYKRVLNDIQNPPKDIGISLEQVYKYEIEETQCLIGELEMKKEMDYERSY